MATTRGARLGGNGWRWRLTTGVTAIALLVVGVTAGYVLTGDDPKAPATRVLGEALTVPQPGGDGAGADATTTTAGAGAVSQSTTSATRAPAAPPGATVTTRGATTTTAGCRNSTDPACGPFRWEGPVANQPLALELRWSPARPAVGQTVTFVLTASDPDAPVEGGLASISFGDGPAIQADPGPGECKRYGLWTLPTPRPGRWEHVYTHAYQRAGTYQAVFGQSSGTPDLPGCVDQQRGLGDPWASTASVRASITVSEAILDRPAWVQPSDNAFSFDYLQSGQRGGASSTGPETGTGVLVFEVQGVVVSDTPPAAVLRATLFNQRSFAVAFPSGLDVVVRVSRNGQPWQDVHLRNPAITTLAPGQAVDVSAEVALPGFGTYAFTGQVAYIGA